EGLSGPDVLGLLEDREGNVWVATQDGLDRFRDFAVPTFTRRQGLLNGAVGSVLATRDGSVWLGTRGGLNRWTNGRITIADTGSGTRDGTLKGLHPHSLFQDDRGRIWVSTNDGVGYLENDRFMSINGIPGENVQALAEDIAGNLWISNVNVGVFRVSARGGVQQIPGARLGRTDPVSAMAADRVHGGLWLGFLLGGIAYFTDGGVGASYAAADGLGEGRVNGLRLDGDGTLWAATD